jgi:hypothetical protein
VSTTQTGTVRLVVLAGIAIALAALSGTPDPAAGASCLPGVERPLASVREAYAGVVRGRAIAYRRPGRNPFAEFERLNENRVPTVLGIIAVVETLACRPVWYRVQLPMRPNGVTGYVRARDLSVGRVRTRIHVDISRRRLALFRSGRRVLFTRVGVGAADTPTPIGRFYVNQRLLSANPRGPFGPAAIGISAFSPTLTGWAQGGPIAIHGTNDPASIGRAASTGCLRARNDVVRRLFRLTPAGTPVVIDA